MALPILDGNQSPTTLSTIIVSNAHVPAHTVTSLGTQAITDIATAVSGVELGPNTLNALENITVTLGQVTITGGLTDTQLRASAVTVGGTITVGSIVTHGVTIANSSVTIGGSVTATISGTPSVTFTQASVTFGTAVITGSTSIIGTPSVTFTQIATHGVTIGAGTAQIGSVTASISGTPSVTFGLISGTVTANPTGTQTIAGTVTASISGGTVAEITKSNTFTNLDWIYVSGSFTYTDGFDVTQTLFLNTYFKRISATQWNSFSYSTDEDKCTATILQKNSDGQGFWSLDVSYLGISGGISSVIGTLAVFNLDSPAIFSEFPPSTGWVINTAGGFAGSVSISHEQPSVQQVSTNNAGWELIISKNWNANQDQISNLDITGYSELAIQQDSSGSTSTTVQFVTVNSTDNYWVFGNLGNLGFGVNRLYFTKVQYLPNLYVSISNWDSNETQTTTIWGRTSTSLVTTSELQGTSVTNSNFTSTTPSTVLVYSNSSRTNLTVFNEGAGNIHINAGATCTTIGYQVRLSAGDYWEAPAGQVGLQHSAVFATAGTARVTQIY
jgi:hypothetical protein